jgi:hypothetical protein
MYRQMIQYPKHSFGPRECPIAEPSGQSFLSGRYDTAIFCFSKGLPFSSAVPGVPSIPSIPAKEAKNRPTLSMR